MYDPAWNPAVDIFPKHLLSVKLPAQQNDANSFTVKVTNRAPESLSFDIHIYRLGCETSDTRDWYSLRPRVRSKYPPRDTAEFHVNIEKNPIPGSEERIPIAFKVSALEDRRIATTVSGYFIQVQTEKYLFVDLRTPEDIALYPDEAYELPVRIRNLRSRTVEADLQFEWRGDPAEVDSLANEWEIKPTKEEYLLKPNQEKDISLWVMPPPDRPLAGTRYPFALSLRPRSQGAPATVEGQFRILPEGTIRFDADAKLKQPFPGTARGRRGSDREVVYPLQVKNDSNTPARLRFSLMSVDPGLTVAGERVSESDYGRLRVMVGTEERSEVTLEPNETRPVQAVATIHRRPLWRDRTLQFDLQTSWVGDDAAAMEALAIAPNHCYTLTLVLRTRRWWKVLGILLLLLGILLYPVVQALLARAHPDTVTTVNILDRGKRVLSGAKDGSIFRWEVYPAPLQHLLLKWQSLHFIRQVDEAIAPVRVIRDRSQEDSENVFAVGLENGDIQLWNLIDSGTPLVLNTGGDNIFDLHFSQDAAYLFSSHGSGRIRIWRLSQLEQGGAGNNRAFTPQPIKVGDKALYALEDTPHIPGERLLLMGGQANQLWAMRVPRSSANLSSQGRRLYNLSPLFAAMRRETADFAPILDKDDYITSMAADDRFLAIADTQGYVQVWNVRDLSDCLRSLQPQPQNRVYRIQACDRAPLVWQSREIHTGFPVRAVALVGDGRECYHLASVGDDGRVMLTSFPARGLNPADLNPRPLAAFPEPLNSVDVYLDDDYDELFVASDAEGNRVKLYRYSVRTHADCQ